MTTCQQCPHKPRKRSTDAHRMFFGVIKAAFNHWQEGHQFVPRDEEHLRAWLLIRAGHCQTLDVADLDVDAAVMQKQIAAAFSVARALDAHGALVTRGSQLQIVVPKSIKYDKLSEREFAPIRDSVYEVIRKETGFYAEELLRQNEAAA